MNTRCSEEDESSEDLKEQGHELVSTDGAMPQIAAMNVSFALAFRWPRDAVRFVEPGSHSSNEKKSA